jgi:hypothetical protein
MNRSALLIATAIGLAAQIAMVIAGHHIPVVRNEGFAIGGMGISFVAGLIYARLAPGAWAAVLGGGAIAGGACAIIAIAVSVALGDVPVLILAIGTLSSAVTGLIGGAIGKLIF